MTMRKSIQTAAFADARLSAGRFGRRQRAWAALFRSKFRSNSILPILTCGLFCGLGLTPHAQQPAPTGPQQLTFAGLRTVPNSQGQPEGQINAVSVDAQGNLILLIDQKDGVRVLKTDGGAGSILAQAQIGAQGDIGLAMAQDPAGNIYVTGTTTSGAMTATSGAAFLTPSGSSTNSFIAKFDGNLNIAWVSFAGGGSMAAGSIAVTGDAVFITGSIFSATLPVTPAAITQAPASGSTQNGFVEKFSASGSTLLYATYLSGFGGNTAPAAIAADSSDDAFIAGTTTSAGYPTIVAVVPAMLGATSGFLTKLTPGGDGIIFSTYIPGAGITSLAIDPAANNLLLSGAVSLGQFPVATVVTPLTATTYQVLLRMTLDGSTLLGSTLLAPGTQSFVAAGASGTAWVDGSLGLPLLPLAPLAPFGNSFAVRVNTAGAVDQTARYGGIAASNPGSASAPVALTSIAVDASGGVITAGSFAPSASQSLLVTQTFDLPLESAPTAAFPSSVHAAVLPPSACNGSLCAGSAAFLAKLAIPANAAAATASLVLSIDDSPNLTLRNLGSAEAAGVQINVSGFGSATNCGAVLPAGGECSIALTGSGPGSITVTAANAAAQSQTLPALAVGATPIAVVFTPKELDFGIVSSASGAVTQTITITNLTQQNQTFISALDANAKTTLPYSFAETASDCTLAGVNTKLLAPGGVCHITIGLTASTTPANDGPIHANWLIGTRDVQMTAYGKAAALSLSSGEVDFGTQYTGGLRLPRYLYLSNNSTVAAMHAAVTLPATSPFSVSDGCPGVLEPLTVCQLQLAYQTAHTPSSDSVTLSLDQGLTALVTGTTLPQPSVNGASVNPSLSVSAESVFFANAVVVTGVSASTQTLTVQNAGANAFSLALALTGDFSDTTNCGTTLAGGATCSVVLSFVPSQPGARQGLLAITAGAGTTPDYVTLSGAATRILSPANNGTIGFGGVIAGQLAVQWIKVTQPFTSFTAATSGAPFSVVRIEDIGYGHGQPASTTFTGNASGTCFNCWIGVEFTPASTGAQMGTLTLTSTSGGNPYVLSLTGTGLPLTGLLLTPVVQDFGPVPIHSASGAQLFVATNLVAGGNAITLTAPALTGDFAVSNVATGGATCGGALAYAASCFVEIAFTPTAAGPRTGTLTLQAGSATVSATLSGYGSTDAGLALSPTALTFNNVPSATAIQQSVTLTNTSAVSEQIGTPVAITTGSALSSFSATSACAALAPGANCAVMVLFTPGSAPVSGTLTIPVTSMTSGGAPVVSSYTVPLSGAYTSVDAGLEILPGVVEYGPQATGGAGVTRQFTVNNLTGKSLALNVALPRQFALSGVPCTSLAANASCNFAAAFLPLANGDITGTISAQGTPTDGSAMLNGLSYVEGYGIGAGALSITGGVQTGGVLSFGQVPSGQSATRVLTLTNSASGTPLTIRRVTSGWPFLSTTTCGATLGPAASCAVTLAYTPINQAATGSNPPLTTTDTGTLTIESDAISSPDLVELTGASTPVLVGSPSNGGPLAAFTATPSSLSFTSTSVGSASAPQTVTLTNTGNATLTIFGVQSTGAQSTADFPVTSNCATLVAGASCTVSAVFTPQPGTGASTRSGAIEISSNAGTSLEFVSLAGVSNPATLTLGSGSLSFGTVLVGASSSMGLQLTNNGASGVTINSYTASGDYSVAAGTCPQPGGTLAAGASCMLQITFSPSQPGMRAGTLSIASSATPLPLSASLTGSGAQAQLQINPDGLAFGSVSVGSSASLSLTLLNTGTAAITGITLSITGDYSVAAPCGSTTLAGGASCSVTISFTPAAAGTRAGILTITSSDPGSPASIPLSGTGVANGSFTLTVNGASSASATVTSGSPATYALAVTPTNGFNGTVVLNCTPVTPAQYATCSLLPSSVMLGVGTQSAAATINTVTSIAASSREPIVPGEARNLGSTALALLFPTLVFMWKARTSRHRAWRQVGPVAWAVVMAIALLSANGCGGGGASANTTGPTLRYTPAGSYQYQVTASGTSGVTQITQTVTLNLTVQ